MQNFAQEHIEPIISSIRNRIHFGQEPNVIIEEITAEYNKQGVLLGPSDIYLFYKAAEVLDL